MDHGKGSAVPQGGSPLYKPWNIVLCNFPYKDGVIPPKPHHCILLATEVEKDGKPVGHFMYTTSGAKLETGRVPFHIIRITDAEAHGHGFPKGFEIDCSAIKKIPLDGTWIPKAMSEPTAGVTGHLPKAYQERIDRVMDLMRKADERSPQAKVFDLMAARKRKTSNER